MINLRYLSQSNTKIWKSWDYATLKSVWYSAALLFVFACALPCFWLQTCPTLSLTPTMIASLWTSLIAYPSNHQWCSLPSSIIEITCSPSSCIKMYSHFRYIKYIISTLCTLTILMDHIVHYQHLHVLNRVFSLSSCIKQCILIILMYHTMYSYNPHESYNVFLPSSCIKQCILLPHVSYTVFLPSSCIIQCILTILMY